MGDYTQLNLKRAQDIVALYRNETISELSALSLGISNSNYKLTLSSGDVVLLKVSNDKNREQLQGEQDILETLHALGYPFSLRAYKTKKETILYDVGDYYGVMYPFMEGIPPGPSDITCEEIGRALAALHRLDMSKLPTTIRSHEEVGYGVSRIQDYLSSATAQKYYVDCFHRVFPNGLSHFTGEQLETGIIHGDLYYDNTLFHNEKVAAVLDFEQAGLGEYLLDLGISMSGTCLEKGLLHPGLIASFLKGYESLRPLPHIEKELLTDAICLGLFSISLWRIKRFTEGGLNPVFKDAYKDLLHKAIAYKEELL